MLPVPSAPTTPRAELAKLAASTAMSVDGVAGLRAGTPPVFVTDLGPSRLTGVSVVAVAAGRYEITVCIAVALVPLHALARAVREAVHARARSAGLEERIETVTVRIEEMVSDDAPPGRPS